MLTYSQTTGELRSNSGELIGVGFSGYQNMKNRPEFEDTLRGPIPKRVFTIFLPRLKQDGSWTMVLQPQTPVARPHGTFSMQAGDDSTVSYGCIVLPKNSVAQVVDLYNLGEHQLRVIL